MSNCEIKRYIKLCRNTFSTGSIKDQESGFVVYFRNNKLDQYPDKPTVIKMIKSNIPFCVLVDKNQSVTSNHALHIIISAPYRVMHNSSNIRVKLDKSTLTLLKKHTNIPKTLLSSTKEKKNTIIMSASMCKQYGLIDRVIDDGFSGGCGCSQGLHLGM